ncbi:MAG: DUF5615 family PIN-like protein [Thermodesulfobacteriota bacterium]
MFHFKLDENADPRWREPLEDQGHVVTTVAEEELAGTKDKNLAAICLREGYSLITADLGFAQTLV